MSTQQLGTTWNTRGMTGSARSDWATPYKIFAALDREFHFMLDACATLESARCDRFLSAGALDCSWGAGPVWLNPPYGRKIGEWIRKAWEESQRGVTVVCLLPARTDTSWWHNYCMRGEIRFVRGRINFDSGRGRCPFPSSIVVFRRSA